MKRAIDAKYLVLLGVFATSFSAIFAKWSTAPALYLAAYRMIFSMLFLFPAALGSARRRREILGAARKNILLSLLSGVFLAFHFTCYFESVIYTSITSSTVLVSTEVLFVAFATLVLFRQRIPSKGLLGIAAALSGTIIIAMGDRGGGSNVLYGDVMALSGAFFMAVYTMIGMRVRKAGMSTTGYTFYVYTSAALVLLGVALVSGAPLLESGLKNVFLGFLLAVVCTMLGHSVFSWGLKYCSAAFISTAKLCEPVFASILGLFLFRQVPGVWQIGGGLVILAGIFLYTSVEREAA